MTKQVKSKQRVADHGEVFTAEREVKAMCDLVKTETERIDSRFLEPACGDGNFLAEILSRKLVVVKKKYKKFPMDYRKKLRSGRQQPVRCGYSTGQLRDMPGTALSDVGQGVQSRLQKGS